MKILIFTEGTILLHYSALGKKREEIVSQVQNQETGIYEYQNYKPNGKAITKVNCWKQQGADIFYLSSRSNLREIKQIKSVLRKYHFSDWQNLLYRKKKQGYGEIVEKLIPNVLIEDDCESIGGKLEMTYPNIKPELKRKIKSVIVKEFEGIDHLPDNIDQLCQCK